MKVLNFVMLVCVLFAGTVSAANPQVTLHITGAVSGDIVLELYPEDAPVTVENFINYVQADFYDGLIFHRVIDGFMIQGGGCNTEPNFVPTGPPIINESINGLSNLRGTIAMARLTHPHSATSQFFINHTDNIGLNMGLVFDGDGNGYYRLGYTVFGQVVSGLDVVDAIAGTPTSDVTINSIFFEGLPDSDVIIQTAELTTGVPACLEKLDGDVDEDCDVDFTDFALLADDWLFCNAINSCQ
jgi:cyclophilin family peptidyl-prolyl cis-trans isomerase